MYHDQNLQYVPTDIWLKNFVKQRNTFISNDIRKELKKLNRLNRENFLKSQF